MKYLLSKKHYCYKTHTLLMQSSAYPSPSINNHLYGLTPFLQENLDPSPPMIFQKSRIRRRGGGRCDGGVHTIVVTLTVTSLQTSSSHKETSKSIPWPTLLGVPYSALASNMKFGTNVLYLARFQKLCSLCTEFQTTMVHLKHNKWNFFLLECFTASLKPN